MGIEFVDRIEKDFATKTSCINDNSVSGRALMTKFFKCLGIEMKVKQLIVVSVSTSYKGMRS